MSEVNPRDWGAFVVSLILLGFFGAYEVAVLFMKVPSNDSLSNILNNMLVLVAGYWIGSSLGSKNKDAALIATTTMGAVGKVEGIAKDATVSPVTPGTPSPLIKAGVTHPA